MISRRLVAAAAVQVAAAAALATPASADRFWPREDCTGEELGTYIRTGTEIKWAEDDWTVIADGFLCTSSGWSHEGFWSEDTDDAGLSDAMDDVEQQCELGGSGAT